MKKILITGVAGFIGSHLAEFFINKGFKVYGIDNFMTGSIDNLKNVFSSKNFHFIEADICKKINFREKIDYIIHLASPASPKDYLKFPIKTLKIGSIGTENVLEIGIKSRSVVLVASTSEIYGDPLEHPQKESYFGNVNPIGPRGVYDEAKRYLEALTMAYKKKKKLNVRIVRIFNTYGPKMRKNDGRAIPAFINQALSNKNITIYGDGKQTRSFCYISDTINGIYRLLESEYSFPVNIGNPKEYSIMELANKIKFLTNSESKLSFSELPENDPKIRKPDISLAKKILKWNPIIELEDGLKLTVNYFRNLS